MIERLYHNSPHFTVQAIIMPHPCSTVLCQISLLPVQDKTCLRLLQVVCTLQSTVKNRLDTKLQIQVGSEIRAEILSHVLKARFPLQASFVIWPVPTFISNDWCRCRSILGAPSYLSCSKPCFSRSQIPNRSQRFEQLVLVNKNQKLLLQVLRYLKIIAYSMLM